MPNRPARITVCSHLRPVARHHGHWFHVLDNGELSPMSCVAGVHRIEIQIPIITLGDLVPMVDRPDQPVWLDTLKPVI